MRKVMHVLTLFSAVSVLAQQNVPPPPPSASPSVIPTDSGPSLEATMNFIEEKLNSIGRISFAQFQHDGVKDIDLPPIKMSYKVTSVRAIAKDCRVDYHYWSAVSSATVPERVLADKDSGFSLREVQEVGTATGEQALKEANSKAGRPELNFQVDPPTFVLFVKLKSTKENFRLYDASLAERLTKALQHAVELCGGGSKDPF